MTSESWLIETHPLLWKSYTAGATDGRNFDIMFFLVLAIATASEPPPPVCFESLSICIPRLGLGTAGLGGFASEAVATALHAGIRLIDTAQAPEWYDEEQVGRGLDLYCHRRHLYQRNFSAQIPVLDGASDSHCSVNSTRIEECLADLSIVTKIHPRSFRADRMKIALDRSRTLLYPNPWFSDSKILDIALLHSPYCWPDHCSEEEVSHSWQNAWLSLERLQAQNRVAAIGVSNFDLNLMKELMQIATPRKVALVQNWMDPLHQDLEVRRFAQQQGIVYMAYSSLGTQWAGKFSENPVLGHRVLLELAAHHKASVPAIIHAWLLQEGVVAIPRSSTAAHISENADFARGVKRVHLSVEEMKQIQGLDGTLGSPWS